MKPSDISETKLTPEGLTVQNDVRLLHRTDIRIMQNIPEPSPEQRLGADGG